MSEYFKERGIGFWTIPAPPERNGTVEEDTERLGRWYTALEDPTAATEELDGSLANIGEVVEALDRSHENRITEIGSMPERTLDSVWWPFTQHGLVNKKEDVMVIDSAFGDNFDAYYAESSSTEAAGTESRSTVSSAPALISNGSHSQSSLLNSYFDGSASWFT